MLTFPSKCALGWSKYKVTLKCAVSKTHLRNLGEGSDTDSNEFDFKI